MFKNAKVVSLIPDQMGKGGTKSAPSTQIEIIDTKLLYNAFVFMGRWRAATQARANPNYSTAAALGFPAIGAGRTNSMASFSVFDLTNAALPPTNYILAHSQDGGNPPAHFLLNHTPGANVAEIATGGTTPDSFTPAIFQTIANRCFICWSGQSPSTVIPNYPTAGTRATNNIIYDPTNTNIEVYDIGIDPPPSAPTYTISGSGNLSWGAIAPIYQYAYYDNTTGHISNPSPPLQITETNQSGVKVNLSNLIQSPTNDQYRFGQIVIFRTVTNQTGGSGGVLYPISSQALPPSSPYVGPNNSGSGGTTYTDNNGDALLLVAAGLQAPALTNGRPPILSHMAYWDGRVWANPVSDVTAIIFSCDTVQCTFGVPEESWPSSNLLRIPAKDGRVTGMTLVGPYLVITTQRYAYYVSGGPDENTYRLLRFSTTTFGVADYQMTEWAGDTDQNSAALMYLGGDAKMYMLAPSYGNVSISEPIQDVIFDILSDDAVNFQKTIIAPVVAGSQKLLAAMMPGPAQATLVYDFDHKIWSVHSFDNGPFTAYATVYNALSFNGQYRKPVDFLLAKAGTIYSWIMPTTESPFPEGGGSIGQAVNRPRISTPPLDFGRKSQKQLNFVRIYVSGGISQTPTAPSNPQNWTIGVAVDEQPEVQYTPAVNPDPNYRLQDTGSLSLDSPTARELVLFLPGAVPGTGSPCRGYRFTITIYYPTAQFPSSSDPYDIYKLDACYSDQVDSAITVI